MAWSLFYEFTAIRVDENSINFILSKYYHRISEGVNSFRYLLLPITVLVAPVILVATQPDLGTSILIAAGGVIVAWLAGVRAKFFTISGIAMLLYCPLPSHF